MTAKFALHRSSTVKAAWITAAGAVIAAATLAVLSKGRSEQKSDIESSPTCAELNGLYRDVRDKSTLEPRHGFPARPLHCAAPLDTFRHLSCSGEQVVFTDVSFNQIFRTFLDDTREGEYCGNDPRDQVVCSYVAEWRFSGTIAEDGTIRVEGSPFDRRRGIEECLEHYIVEDDGDQIMKDDLRSYIDRDINGAFGQAECNVKVAADGDRLETTCLYEGRPSDPNQLHLERWTK